MRAAFVSEELAADTQEDKPQPEEEGGQGDAEGGEEAAPAGAEEQPEAEAEAAAEPEPPEESPVDSCDEAVLLSAVSGALSRLGWAPTLAEPLAGLLRAANARGMVLHSLDEAGFSLQAFEDRRVSATTTPESAARVQKQESEAS